MKKLILTTTAMAGTALVAHCQGNLLFNDESTAGFVVQSSGDHNSTASYVASPNFTAALYALPGNVTSTAGLGIDAYGYLTPSQLATDGFVLLGSTLGGSANGVSFGGGDGYFDGGAMNLTGTTQGGFTAPSGPYTKQDVIAVVAWTGTAANLAAAITGGASVGIFAFVNDVGPGGTSPNVPNMTGWPTQLSPSNVANDGFPELVLAPVAPVPEPATLALAGLGGLASLVALRRKKA